MITDPVPVSIVNEDDQVLLTGWWSGEPEVTWGPDIYVTDAVAMHVHFDHHTLSIPFMPMSVVNGSFTVALPFTLYRPLLMFTL